MIQKRTFDILLALILTVVLLPVYFVIAGLIYCSLGRPIFFTQQRPGFKGKPFFILKFRTMANLYDHAHQPLDDAQRMTSLGKFLRKYSLDELPELWNVLKGEMSLVGPRPLLMEYLPRYNAEQMTRHDVFPGITGWAQINGRNDLDWDEKFKLDIWYVQNQSLALDIKILLRTLKQLAFPSGVNKTGHVTTPPFLGNRS